MNKENVASELLRLERGGLIQPKAAVEWARAHPSSALHAELEWDDAVAGEQYRIQQVRQLVAIFVNPQTLTRQYVSLSVDRVEGGGYRRIEQVLGQQDLRTVLLQDALHELQRMQAKYAELQELDKVWAAAAQVQPPQPGKRPRGRPKGSGNKKTAPQRKR
jgi:hypothetical protein